MISSRALKDIVAEARPIIERQLDDAEIIAGLRDVVASQGGDWSALKALIKAQIQDERDETGNGKRVKKIIDKADFSTGYAEMLGWRNMNEKNFSAEEDFDPITGEFLEDGEAVGIASDLPTNSPSDDDAIAAVKGNARLANVADVEPSSSAPNGPSEDRREGQSLGLESDANTGGSHVALNENAAPIQAVPGLVSTPRTATIPSAVTFEVDPPVPMKRASFAHCFPELTKAQYEALEADIIASPCGVEEPIVRKGDVILDGFCRFNIARSLSEEYPVIEYDGSDELLDVIRWQRSSRDWTPQQEAKIAKALAAEVPARAEEIFSAFHIALNDIEEVVAA